MHTTSVYLLLLAAAGVAILHSILPDHWVPLAVVAGTNRWGMSRVAKIPFLASIGHVVGHLYFTVMVRVTTMNSPLNGEAYISYQQGSINLSYIRGQTQP